MARHKLREMSAAGEPLAEEEPLARGARLEDPDWFTPFVRAHSRRVFGLLYRMVGNAGDAQDLAQEVFLRAYQHRDQLRDASKATSWLLRIATNRAIDFQRSAPVQRLGFSLDDEKYEPFSEGLPSDTLTPEQEVLRGERHSLLWSALQGLSPKERAALVLRDIEGRANREVAGMLGCSMITVRTHIAAARVKIKKYMEKEGRRERNTSK
jgi:RNA polymerase sigma-70 factor (ECF subfamily)